VLSIELEDVPGVSRPGVEDADPVYDEELVKAIEFLRGTAKEANVRLE